MQLAGGGGATGPLKSKAFLKDLSCVISGQRPVVAEIHLLIECPRKSFNDALNTLCGKILPSPSVLVILASNGFE